MPCPVFASYTLAFALQLRKKQGSRKVPRYPGKMCPVHIHTNNTQNNTMTQNGTYITIRILNANKEHIT
jgi:hypothetical protein